MQIGGKTSNQAGESSIERLMAGNRRFLDAIAASPDPAAMTAQLAQAAPYAVILGCADSRVSPESIFNESLGRLFVIRVVAQVAGPAELGSVEYAVARWNCPLVVVLGHTQCAGIAAVMDRPPAGVEPAPTAGSTNVSTLLSTIKSNLGWSPSAQSTDPWLDAVKRNMRRTRESLLTWSPPLRHRVTIGELSIVEALYHVETGEVEFVAAG